MDIRYSDLATVFRMLDKDSAALAECSIPDCNIAYYRI